MDQSTDGSAEHGQGFHLPKLERHSSRSETTAQTLAESIEIEPRHCLESLSKDDRLCDWIGRRQWITWRNVRGKNGLRKEPFLPGNLYAKCNAPDAWISFYAALRWHKLGESSGISFGLTDSDEYCGIDLDDCRDPATGHTEEWAIKIIRAFDTYTEVSPSMDGYRLFGIGKIGRGIRHKIGTGEFEAYDRGRFLTVTGMRTNGKPIRNVQSQVDTMKLWIESKRPKMEDVAGNHKRTPANIEHRAMSLAKVMEPAVSGSGGHIQIFKAAIAFTRGLCMDVEQALPFLAIYNERCNPPFSDWDMKRKLRDASGSDVKWGYLLS